MDFIWFVLFSTIEGMSFCVFMLSIYRFDYKHYLKEIVFACILFSIISYACRVELKMDDFSPLLTIAFFSSFAFSILRAPPIWSIIISGTTIVATFVVQTLLMLLLTTTNLITLDTILSYGGDARILQTISALLFYGISIYLYKKGYGFAFSFNSFRWKGDNLSMFILLIVTYGLFAVMFIRRSLFYGVIVETILISFLVYLAIRKERAEI